MVKEYTLVVHNIRILKHFAPWEHILLLGQYFGLRVLKHFWTVWFFWSKYLNKFTIKLCIKTWYSSQSDSICFNTAIVYTTDAQFYKYSVNLGSIFFSSSDMHQFHHLLGSEATGINSSNNSFLCSLSFSSMISQAKILIRIIV